MAWSEARGAMEPRPFWAGRQSASRGGDCQQQGGRELGTRGMVNSGEVLLKTVMFDKPKLLTGLNQKVRGQVWGLSPSPPRMMRHRPTGTTYTPQRV